MVKLNENRFFVGCLYKSKVIIDCEDLEGRIMLFNGMGFLFWNGVFNNLNLEYSKFRGLFFFVIFLKVVVC